MSDSTLMVGAAILFLALGEWAFVFFCGPYVLVESKEPKRLAYRLSLALLFLGVSLLQAHLYWSIACPQPTDSRFLTGVYVIEHLVSLVLLFKAALKARSM
jgi:membrane protease YdiL (CAAX protease family)